MIYLLTCNRAIFRLLERATTVGHQSIEEDKPYISYNKEKASLVALSFDEVPITEGVYMTLSGINHGGEVNT